MIVEFVVAGFVRADVESGGLEVVFSGGFKVFTPAFLQPAEIAIDEIAMPAATIVVFFRNCRLEKVETLNVLNPFSSITLSRRWTTGIKKTGPTARPITPRAPHTGGGG